MNNSPFQSVADWMKTTDLAEIIYRKNGTGFSLTAPGAGEIAVPNAPMVSGRFSPVVSDGVGVFQWSEPGQARSTEEGSELSVGDVIGVISAGPGVSKPIIATRAGKVAKIFIDAGAAVEYGQPLLLLENR